MSTEAHQGGYYFKNLDWVQDGIRDKLSKAHTPEDFVQAGFDILLHLEGVKQSAKRTNGEASSV